jgi:hypothetical protein
MSKFDKWSKFLVLAFIILFLSVSSPAKATTIQAETTTRTGSCGPLSQWVSSYPFSYYVQRFNHYWPQNNVNQLYVNFLGKNPSMQVVFYICKGVISNTIQDATCTGSGQSVFGTETKTIASSTVGYTWTPATPIEIGSQDLTFISVTKATNFAMGIYQSGTVNDYCYTYDISYPMGGWTPSGYDSRHKSLDFTSYYADDFKMPANMQVMLISPADGQSYYQTSLVFSGYFRADNKTADGITIEIFNKDLNQTVKKSFAMSNGVRDASGVKTFGNIGDSVATPMAYNLAGASQWTAWLTWGGVRVSTNTPINNFFLGSSTNPIYNNQTFSTSTICIDDDLTSVTGQFSCAWKVSMSWMFYPSESSLDSLKVSSQKFKESFPFNVYFQLTTTVSSVIASTTITQNGSIGLPMIDSEKHIYITPFLSSSSVPKAIGQANTTLIRNTLVWLAWLIVAIAIFFEIRKF